MTFPQTDRTKLKRLPKRGHFDRETVYEILDEGFICHIGFVVDGRPVVIPTGYARVADKLYIHGSQASRMLRTLAGGIDACFTVTLLDVKPILSLDPTGRILPVDRVRGRDNVVPRVLSLLEKRLTPRPKSVRFGVVHAEAPDVAERVRTALVAAYQPRDCFVSLATGVLGTHVGAGAWAVFYMVED